MEHQSQSSISHCSAFQYLSPKATATFTCAVTAVTPHRPPRVHSHTHIHTHASSGYTPPHWELHHGGVGLSKPPPYIMDLLIPLVPQSRHVTYFPVWQSSFLHSSQIDSVSAVTFDLWADLPGARSGGHTSESAVNVRRAHRHGERRDVEIRQAELLFLEYRLLDIHYAVFS